MEARAQQSYLGKLKEPRTTHLQQTQEKHSPRLAESRAPAAQAATMSPEQQAEVERTQEEGDRNAPRSQGIAQGNCASGAIAAVWTRCNIGVVPRLVALLDWGWRSRRRARWRNETAKRL